MVEAPRDELVGRTLGEFVVHARLGEGGFGAVYRAQQPLLGREAVIKVLQTRLRRNETAVQRFLREARLASRIDHPYAAHIYAFGVEKDGLLWIAMELVDGTPLDRMLRDRSRLPLDQAIPLIEKLCEVIHAAHVKGIVHRDIKPSNVMVLARSNQLLPKLLDLGIAKTVVSGGADTEELRNKHSENRDPTPTPTPAADDATAQLGGDSTVQLAVPQAPAQLAVRALTLDGTVLGSPPYMAPEQWADSAAADERTDLYALGILAFEVLAGRRPFEGRSVGEICIAHTEHPVPPLGAGQPEALDEVLAKALAKQPGDRYATALDFAAALRAAAGLSPEAEPVPRLPATVRETWIGTAPQPIAEAVAALEAARSVREARDAYRDLVSTIVHYAGVLALACQSRIGSTTPDLAPAVELLRELRRRRFLDDDWRAFVQAVGASDPSQLAIPELAGAELTFEPAAALAQAKTDRQIRELLEIAIAGLVVQLGQLGFLLAYPLGVVREDRIELWTGMRRPRRASLPREGGLAANVPVVLGRLGSPEASAASAREIGAGRLGSPEASAASAREIGAGRSAQVVLELAPIVEVAQPTPGAPEELFLIDGRGNRGARLVALPIGFERNRDDIWDWFGAHLLDSAEISREIAGAEDAPYPGLSAFTAGDAAKFFGREKEVEAFLNRLRVQSLLAVVGASGSGKSSFVQAGVVPNLPEGWRAITIRPGPTPLASLEAVLRKLDQPRELAGDPAAFALALREAGNSGTIVLIIDQFEELFTHGRDPAERLAFAEALAGAVRVADDPVRVILTLRDDFLIAAEQLAPLRDRLAWGLQLLATPGRAELARILTEPARRAGFAFEDVALTDEMIDAVADLPGSLALLAFTAAELWAQRDRKTRRITRASYVEMGGVGGALARHADGVVESMVADERRLVRETFRHVVTADGTRAVLNREDLRRSLGDPRADAVLAKLVNARLLVTSEGPESEDRIEIVHEALIAAWPRLRDWLREDAEGALLRDQLRAAARQWHDRGRPTGLLWRGDALAEYERWRKRYTAQLGELDEAFASASLAEARRGRRIRRTSIAVAFAVLTIAIVILVYLRSVAERERSRAETLSDEAKQQVVDGLVEQGRQALLAGDASRAAGHLADAYDKGARGQGLEIMLASATRPLQAQIRTFALGAPVRRAELSADGKRLLVLRVGESRVGIIDLETGDERRFEAGTSNVSARLDPSGTRLATNGTTPRVFGLSGQADLALRHDGSHVDQVVWSSDGLRIVGRTGASVVVWSAATGEVLKAFSVTGAVALAIDRERAVAASNATGLVWIWDLETGKQRELRGHEQFLTSLEFSLDGSQLVSASADASARIWDTASGTSITLRHRDAVKSVVLLSSGVILTASADKTAKLWRIVGGEASEIRSLDGHPSRLTATMNAGGSVVATAGTDGRVCLHDVTSGLILECFEGHAAPITSVQFTHDGTKLATASLDGTVRLWRADARRFTTMASDVDWDITALDGRTVVAREAGRLVARAIDRDVPLWSNGSQTSMTTLALSSDGASVIATGREVVILDAATGAVASSIGIEAIESRLARDHVVIAGDQFLEIRSRRSPAEVRRIDTTTAQPAIVVTADGGRAASWGSRDHAVHVFDLEAGRLLHALVGHTALVSDLAFGPADRLASASHDGSVRIWDRDGHLVCVLSSQGAGGVSTARFAPDGQRVFTGHEDGSVRIWRASGGELAVMRGHEGLVSTLAVDRSGEIIASGGLDGVVVLWDLARGVPLLRLHGHTGAIRALTFSDDGNWLVTVSDDRSIKRWRVHDNRSIAELRGTVQHSVQNRH